MNSKLVIGGLLLLAGTAVVMMKAKTATKPKHRVPMAIEQSATVNSEAPTPPSAAPSEELGQEPSHPDASSPSETVSESAPGRTFQSGGVSVVRSFVTTTGRDMSASQEASEEARKIKEPTYPGGDDPATRSREAEREQKQLMAEKKAQAEKTKSDYLQKHQSPSQSPGSSSRSSVKGAAVQAPPVLPPFPNE